MEHKDALKGFRSGCSIDSASRRMSLIDSFNISSGFQNNLKKPAEISWDFNENDMKHIFRVTDVVLRQDGLACTRSEIPFNVYSNPKRKLSQEVLDDKSVDIGKYLVQKFMCCDNLLGLSKSDMPHLDAVESTPALKAKLKKNIGVTIKRSLVKPSNVQSSERDTKEGKRTKLISTIIKQTNHLSSDMNMCQALVKPDCSKPKIQKSSTIKLALQNLIKICDPSEEGECIKFCEKSLPQWLTQNVKIVTVEFAGVKFKTKVISGTQYLNYVQNAILSPLLNQMPALNRIIVCEEKYTFTPDNFKAGTRQQRKKTSHFSVSHLKTSDDILSSSIFDKDAIRGTGTGKSLISNYLAANVHLLNLPRAVILDIDSELNLNCTCEGACPCDQYATPIRCNFPGNVLEKPSVCNLFDIHQKKGEAEMSQADWLVSTAGLLDYDDTVISLVTSGDIDAVIIHLFALAKHWPRNDNGTFKNTVYVILQKPQKKYDIYNITLMLEILETFFKSRMIGIKVALGLCMGGNDFIPKLKGKSHDKFLKTYLFNDHFLNSLIDFTSGIVLNSKVFEDFVKNLFCPKGMDAETASFEDVRNKTMQRNRRVQGGLCAGLTVSNADNWMPPSSVIGRLANLVQLQIDYLQTVGDHSAPLPDFMSVPCLKRTSSGEIEYDFGLDAFKPADEVIFESEMGKRKQPFTPQKDQRKKRQVTSTPKKKK